MRIDGSFTPGEERLCEAISQLTTVLVNCGTHRRAAILQQMMNNAMDNRAILEVLLALKSYNHQMYDEPANVHIDAWLAHHGIASQWEPSMEVYYVSDGQMHKALRLPVFQKVW